MGIARLIASGIFQGTMGGGGRRTLAGAAIGGAYGGLTSESQSSTGVFRDIARGATWGAGVGALTTRTAMSGFGFAAAKTQKAANWLISVPKLPPPDRPIRDMWKAKLNTPNAVPRWAGGDNGGRPRIRDMIAERKKPPAPSTVLRDRWKAERNIPRSGYSQWDGRRKNYTRIRDMATERRTPVIKKPPGIADVPLLKASITLGAFTINNPVGAGILAATGMGMYALSGSSSSRPSPTLHEMDQMAFQRGTSVGVLSKPHQDFQNSTIGLVQGLHHGRNS
jgi:hypothetical protein